MVGDTLGLQMLPKEIDKRTDILSGIILNILSLLVGEEDSRYTSARKQVLDAMNSYKRSLVEEIRINYNIIPYHKESITVGETGRK